MYKLYSGFAIQKTIATVVDINEVSEVLQRFSFLDAILLTSLSIFCITAAFEIKYFFNEGSAGVLSNTDKIFLV